MSVHDHIEFAQLMGDLFLLRDAHTVEEFSIIVRAARNINK